MRTRTRTETHTPLVLPTLPAPNPLAKVAGSMKGFGELTHRPAVELWQHFYNLVYDISQEYTGPLRLTGGRIDEDGKYGSQTHAAFKRWVNLAVTIGQCTGLSSSDVERAGPLAARPCLVTTPPFMVYGEDGLTQLGAGWLEWKGGGSANGGDGGGSSAQDGDGGDAGGGDASGGGDGGGDGSSDSSVMPSVTPAGWLGGVLIAVDGLLGAGLAAWSKSWKKR